jgi:hypothetical protein
MAIYSNTPPILTNGLVMYLDAANPRSYVSGSSTTWSNLAGSNFNGTLNNSPGFSPINIGTLVFDGVNDYVNISRPVQDDFTLICWFKTTQNAGNPNGPWYQGMGLLDGEVSGFVNDFGMSMGSGRILFGTGNPDITIRSSTTFNDNIWHMTTATRVRSTGTLSLYVDNILRATGTGNTNSLTSPGNLTIGCLRPLAGFFSGNIAITMVYNKALTQSEIVQIYNANKQRFNR